MNFILMLTHNDRTVPHCVELVEKLRPLRLSHIGFKDVGVTLDTLTHLTGKIKESGARCYLEVVSEDFYSALDSARQAVALGVDCLLGGSAVDATSEVIAESGMSYYPFAGNTIGHPTQLGGTPQDIANHCKELSAWGVSGVDLLAYRAIEAEPLDLIRAAREALPHQDLIVAGSLESPARLAAIKEAGVDAFTMGTALFEDRFAPEAPGFINQVKSVLTFLRTL